MTEISPTMPNSVDNPIVEYWSSRTEPVSFPDNQYDVKRKWKACLLYLADNDIVSTVELLPDRKILLSEMLAILQEQLPVQDPGHTVDCGFKIW